MGRNNEAGAWGERLACRYLRRRFYRILATGYSCRFGEIDIIARKRNLLVFVEVKYRENDKNGHPLQAVSVSKQRTISKCAFYYMQKYKVQEESVRFDVVGILGDEIQVIQNAFDFIV